MKPNYRILEMNPERIVLRDLGPWNLHKTITNDAEGLLAELLPAPGCKVFYFDSEGQYTEILHESGEFRGFAPVEGEYKLCKNCFGGPVPRSGEPAQLEYCLGCTNSRKELFRLAERLHLTREEVDSLRDDQPWAWKHLQYWIPYDER